MQGKAKAADSWESAAFGLKVWLEEEWGEDEGDCCEEFDEDVEAGAGGVLEGVAYGVAYNGGLVGVGFFAAVLAGFDPLLGVVPGAAAVVH